DDQRDRTGGIVLTRCGRAAGERDERGAEKRGCVIQSKHSNSPSLSTPPRPSRRAAEQRDEIAPCAVVHRRRAHYPGGSSGCSCRLLPRSHGLPQMAGGSASALSLSRPARLHSRYGPPDRSAAQSNLCHEAPALAVAARAARQLPDQSTTLRVE